MPMADFALGGVMCLSIWGDGRVRRFLVFFPFWFFGWGDVVIGMRDGK